MSESGKTVSRPQECRAMRAHFDVNTMTLRFETFTVNMCPLMF